ncbi:hypothetical protein HYZ70_03325 [Candidatus Curtissbacteria bacterium]|nr:hypothetical protein [Candidatus Curtissbacteria bacterium]
MKKSSIKSAQKYILDLITRTERVLPEQQTQISPSETKELEFLVDNGHWEVLVKNKTFLILAPEGRVQTLTQALENRTKILRTNLTPLGRTEKTRAAYIQILNHIHDLERLQEEILKEFYTNTGKRQIGKRSKGEKIDFY